jgi:hypothetical protein
VQSKGGRVDRFPLGYNTYSIGTLRWRCGARRFS